MTRRRILVLSLTVALATLAVQEASTASSDFVLIVHKGNATRSLLKSRVSDFFLKKTVKWDDGREVAPIDLPEDSRVRGTFSKQVLGRSVEKVEAYWRSQMFSGKATPPVKVRLDGDVLNYVSNNRGAIGYVSADTFIGGANVKPVRMTN